MRAALRARFEAIETEAIDLGKRIGQRAAASDLASLRADLAHARDDLTSLRSELERVRAGAQKAADTAEQNALTAVRSVKDALEQAVASHGATLADVAAQVAQMAAAKPADPAVLAGGVILSPGIGVIPSPAGGDSIPAVLATGDATTPPKPKTNGKAATK